MRQQDALGLKQVGRTIFANRIAQVPINPS